MLWHMPRGLIRNVEAPILFESFFVAAVASFLGIRWFLGLTGYPQLGTNGLHIAHLLFGGALMLLAMLLQIGFIDRRTGGVSAVIGGLGFGTFIDEIGKFVTADNDYFYRPAVALVYATFVVAFLLTRTFIGQRRLGPREALSNAMRLLAAESDGSIEPVDRARIVRVLERSTQDSERTRLAREYLATLRSERERPNVIQRARAVIAVFGVGTIAAMSAVATTGAVPAAGTASAAVITQVASTIAGAALIG